MLVPKHKTNLKRDFSFLRSVAIAAVKNCRNLCISVHFVLIQNEPKNQEGFIGNFCLWQNHGCCLRFMLFFAKDETQFRLPHRYF
jgi:hypothetical protein